LITHRYDDMKKHKEFKIATYNVFFCPKIPLLKLFMQPKFRFEYQINKMFPKLDQDIYCLQEVTPHFLEILNKSDFSNTYQISKYESSRRNFPLIISKIPFEDILVRDRTIYALFKWEGVNFIVVNAHLNTLGWNPPMRRLEVQRINKNLNM